MANLGKVVITPKGPWTAPANYVKLDCVLYNGSTWLALQNSTGVTPVEGSYWTMMAQGITSTELDEKLDKTGEGKDLTVTFTDASDDGTITSGSKISDIIALIKYKLAAIIVIIGTLSGLATTAKNNIVAAINELFYTKVFKGELIANVKDYGAIGDGSSHALSTKYATLADAQVDYPFVTSLTQELDYAGIQKAVNNNKSILIPDGSYRFGTSTVNITNNNTHIRGSGIGSTAISTNGVTAFKNSNTFRCSIKHMTITADIGVHLDTGSTLTDVRHIRFSGCRKCVQVNGDYTQQLDSISNTISNIEMSNFTEKGIHLYHCGDTYIDNVKVTGTNTSAIALHIDTGVSGLYVSKCNFLSSDKGVLISNSYGISPNTYNIEVRPHQLFFSQVLADTCVSAGWDIISAYQISFIDCWGSGTSNGRGWDFGADSTDSVRQIKLIGCHAVLNSRDGFRWKSGNAHLNSQMVGCHAIANGTSTSNTYDGISIGAGTSGLIIDGCNCYNDSGQGYSNVQKYGIAVEGDVNNVIISNNNLKGANGNVTAGFLYNSTTHTSNMITNNTGYNEVAYADAPTIPTSNTAFTNPYGRPMLVRITGGTVTSIQLQGLTLATTTGLVFPIGAGQTVTIVYSVAPSWTWIGM